MQKSRQRVSALCILLHRQDAECRMQLEFGQPISHRMHRQDADCRNVGSVICILLWQDAENRLHSGAKTAFWGGVALDSVLGGVEEAVEGSRDGHCGGPWSWAVKVMAGWEWSGWSAGLGLD